MPRRNEEEGMSKKTGIHANTTGIDFGGACAVIISLSADGTKAKTERNGCE